MTGPPVDRDRSVVMVTGAYPPDVCGVGDYTGRLMAAAPSSWQLLVERDWTPRNAPGILRRLLRLRPATVIIQYPTQGYGWSLIPHLLVVFGAVTRRYQAVLALHEFTSLSPKARLALAIASHFATRIVFTTEAERDSAQSSGVFSSRVPTSVIGILSNIPWADARPAFGARSVDIAYFGHIRPNKGLEDFLDVVARVRLVDASARIAVIGEIPTGYETFGAMVDTRCRAIGCSMILGLDDQAAGRMLADTRILYLPFPDGVSARRGSVLAGLGNGTIVATRVGAATPAALLPALLQCHGGDADVAVLAQALRWSDAEAAVLQRAGYRYIADVLPRDWGHVASLYALAVAGAR